MDSFFPVLLEWDGVCMAYQGEFCRPPMSVLCESNQIDLFRPRSVASFIFSNRPMLRRQKFPSIFNDGGVAHERDRWNCHQVHQYFLRGFHSPESHRRVCTASNLRTISP